MSGPLKKPRAVYPEEKYVPEDSDEEIEQDEMLGQSVQVDFEGFQASDGDFHGIKRLLQQNFRGLEVDISGIADTVISQNYVGSVIKQVSGDDEEEDDDEEMPMDSEEDVEQVFGVTTIINLTSRKDEKCIAGLRTALVEKCSSHASDSTNQLLRDLLGNESKHVGLLVSERLINLPAQFSLPVFESLRKEIDEAKAKDMPYDFTYLLMICKVYKTEKRKKKKTIEAEMWSNPEEEVIAEESIASFEYCVKGDTGMSGDWDEDDAQYTPYRRVLLLNASRMPEIIAKVKQAIY
ncbi:protein BCCIP homolog [Homarus americanus]|uniref:Protein BCCIP homolog n=1 Tax=Homarus americanus TaxID=6706 RepID=A0A8J5JJK8_HOMAM|nr:protein BCCIP homolog [Homarus americanus]KAG7159327.1 BCCIP-like [Homarus americanus]